MLLSEDPKYTSLELLEVTQHKEQNAFWVTLLVRDAHSRAEIDVLRQRLAQDKKQWRTVIAQSLKRKRVPELKMDLIAEQEV
ncbi:MAG: hypothetical protein AAGJ35_07660, partial [Myxococcota bacterium]